MTLSQLSDFAQIIAAITVIPSLIFVGLQMRQNTRAVRASMSQAHANAYHEIMGRIYDSEELAKLYMKGAASSGATRHDRDRTLHPHGGDPVPLF